MAKIYNSKDKKMVHTFAKNTEKYYDELLMKLYPSTHLREIYGYRTVKQPKYLYVTLPVIEKHLDIDSDFEGYLLTFRKVKLFRIGTEKVKMPICKKIKKGGKISFSRYSELK